MKYRLPGIAFLALLLFSATAQCNTDRPAPADPGGAGGPARIEAGRKVYNFRCYFCHGYSGNAKTVAAGLVNPTPTDFTSADPQRFTPDHIVDVLQHGKPGTAMKSFSGILSKTEMEQVAHFVTDEFVRKKAPNTRYHTQENGWPNHQRYRAAFPFATGEIPLDRPWESLSKEQAAGKRLFMSSCISCHSSGRTERSDIAWDKHPLSYPRNHYSPTTPQTLQTMNVKSLDAMTSASPYVLHDIPPNVPNLTAHERRGKALFEQNCAFCHGADGTGKNWIGSFLEPHPRNLQDPAFMRNMTRALLAARIREGLPNTSMPAWKSVLNQDEIAAIVAYIAKAVHPLPD